MAAAWHSNPADEDGQVLGHRVLTPDEAARVIALEATAQALERAGTPDAAAFARALAYEPGGLKPRQPAREADLHQITAAHDRSRKAGRRHRR